jgi:hypothetical protein
MIDHPSWIKLLLGPTWHLVYYTYLTWYEAVWILNICAVEIDCCLIVL